ncbi:hypothetical protein [Streptomyces sp. NPDC058495]|uniref:hypothetical protein n=1 Tax=unclassified Streptomyces TaxID=2593676 RepID=UPI003669E56B
MANTTLYHFVLTLQAPAPSGDMEVQTWSSTVNVEPGQGRFEIYQIVRAELAGSDPWWADANVTHWSLDRDDLDAPVAPWAPYVPPTQDPTGTTEVRGHLPQQRG